MSSKIYKVNIDLNCSKHVTNKKFSIKNIIEVGCRILTIASGEAYNVFGKREVILKADIEKIMITNIL